MKVFLLPTLQIDHQKENDRVGNASIDLDRQRESTVARRERHRQALLCLSLQSFFIVVLVRGCFGLRLVSALSSDWCASSDCPPCLSASVCCYLSFNFGVIFRSRPHSFYIVFISFLSLSVSVTLIIRPSLSHALSLSISISLSLTTSNPFRIYAPQAISQQIFLSHVISKTFSDMSTQTKFVRFDHHNLKIPKSRIPNPTKKKFISKIIN